MNLLSVKVLPLAVEDVNQALIYIASDNPAAAGKLYDDILQALERAAAFPYGAVQIASGRRVYYKLYVKPYSIYYRVVKNTVVVMRVLHERMDSSRYI